MLMGGSLRWRRIAQAARAWRVAEPSSGRSCSPARAERRSQRLAGEPLIGSLYDDPSPPGFEWFFVALAFFIDLSSYAGGQRARSAR